MRNQARSRWVFAWMFAASALAGCSSDNPAGSGVMCFPACRSGTVCSPAGTCVSACNPACGTGETCEGSGATARCVTATADSGAATTDVASGDTGLTTDAGAPIDASSTGDLGPQSDAPATPTDGPSPDAHVPPTNCGMTGQPCCLGRACFGGGYCDAMTCRPPATRETGECTRSSDCMAGQACSGLFTCSGGADAGVTDAGAAILSRGCFLCVAPPGTGAYGAACSNASGCASGVCSGGHCTEGCQLGPTGDATCMTHGANHRCLNLFFTPVAMGPTTTLGVCAPMCERDADCPADSACMPRLNYVADRMDFACVVPAAGLTGRAGEACNPSGSTTTCRNILCTQTTSATTGYCIAPCTSDADCPATAPVCDRTFTVGRPGGMNQPASMCRPR